MKITKAVVAGVALSMLMSSTAMAGTWKKGAGENQSRWWYDNENGTYAHSGWQWLDGNKDGIAECYYFDSEGWLLTGTTTPDGYQVNADGAWMVNGAVQTKSTAVTNASVDGHYNYYTTAVYVKNGQTNSYDLYKETKRYDEMVDYNRYLAIYDERFAIGQVEDFLLDVYVQPVGENKVLYWDNSDSEKWYLELQDGKWVFTTYESYDGKIVYKFDPSERNVLPCDGKLYESVSTYTVNGDFQPGDFYYPLRGKEVMVKEIYKKK